MPLFSIKISEIGVYMSERRKRKKRHTLIEIEGIYEIL